MPSLPPEPAVLHQVERIFSVPPFSNSALLRRFLQFVLDEMWAGRVEALNQYSIGYHVFDFGPDFNPDSNAVVRVNANRLRRALEKYYNERGQTESVLISMPAGGYRLSLVFGSKLAYKARLPMPAPVLALVEFTGIGLESPWKQFPLLLIEELSVSLGSVSQLRVMGPFRRAGLLAQNQEPAQLGRLHALDFIIDGSVEQIDGELLIHTRLLEGGTGLEIWSRLDRCPLAAPDIADLETTLMQQLSMEVFEDFGAVDQHLSSLARVKPENALSVYEAVLMGRMYLSDFHHESLPQALAGLRRAVREMPDEAAPHATLAVLLSTLGAEPAWPGDPPLDEILQLAERARALDPEDPWSILALATSYAIHRQPAKLAEIGLRVAGSLRATPMVSAVVGVLLCFQKVEVATALRLIERAREGNPHYLRALHLARSLVLLDAGQLDEALREIEDYRVRWGWADPLIRRAIALRQGDLVTAGDEWRRVIAAFPDFETDGQRSIGYLWHADYVRLTCDATLHPVLPAGVSATPAAS